MLSRKAGFLFFIRKTGIVTTPIYHNEKSGPAKAKLNSIESWLVF